MSRATRPLLYGSRGEVVVHDLSIEQRAARAAFGAWASGGYTGARTDRRALKKWTPGLGSANADTIGDLPALRARVRDLERNAPLATGAINTTCTYTVGTGLWPHPRIDREILGLDDASADAWERLASRVFTLWSTRADLTRHQSFTALQDLVLRSTLLSGDVLAIRRFRERSGDLLGLKLQLVEADRICNPNLGGDSDRLIAGVELDEDGARAAYHVRSRHPGDLFLFGASDTWTRMPAVGPQSGLPIALMPFRRSRPDQIRGVPLLAPTIELIKQDSRYSEAELEAAVLASFFTVFIKNALDGLGLGLPEGQLAPRDKGDVELGYGAIVTLANGEDISIANPGRPNAAYAPFHEAMAGLIGVGIEMPAEVLLKRFNSSYSASRAAFLDAWRAVLTRRQWLVDDFCQPAYEWVIEEAVARGYLAAPGFFDDSLVRAAWLGTKWVGDSMGQIDPRSETEAAIARIDAGLSTLEDETAQLTGGDWEQNHAQQVKELRARTSDGLSISPADKIAATQPPAAGDGAPAQSTDPGPGRRRQDEGQAALFETRLAAIERERDTRGMALSAGGPQ